MKILMATHYFGSHRGGIELVADRLFHEFESQGQQVVWVATDASAPPAISRHARPVAIPALNFIEKRLGIPFPIPTVSALRKLRAEVRRADILVLHDCLYLTNIAAFILACLNKVPVVIVQHIGVVPYSNRLLSALMSIGNRLVTRPMLNRAQQVVFISERTKRYFEQLGCNFSATLIFNGVDAEVFRPAAVSAEKNMIRRRLGLPTDQPLMLFVGRFVEKKGLKIFAEMVNLAPEWTWAFAGWGPLDPEAWNSVNVRVFHELRGPDLAELYRASDLFVLPSTGEGFPLVLQEALACGLAVVCSSETAQADHLVSYLVHGVPLGKMDNKARASAFVDVIRNLLQSSSELGSHADELRQKVISRYSWSGAAKSYLELFSSVIVRQRRSTSGLTPIDDIGKERRSADV